jgi:peptidoglycan hydrolase-like protein with peptidoglycan-binding domain
MKPLACLFAFVLAASADELIKNAQTALKEEGFYPGEVTGMNSPETVAAIKRFQKRNNLEATGQLDAATLDALGLSGSGAAPTEPPADPVELDTAPQRPPPVDLRRETATEEKDREFLQRQPPAPAPRPPSGPAAGPYGQVFSRTPYASAPLEVQRDTIRKAQRFLRENGTYRGDLDGLPGPALEEAILSYQRRIQAPLTGRLDLETLSAMRLLPGRGGAPARAGTTARPGATPLRGQWIR